MSVNEEALPGRGKTMYGPAETLPTSSAVANRDTPHIGKEKWFHDMNYGSSSVTYRSRRKVLCRFVRNVSAGTLLPERLVRFASGYTDRVDGYTATTAQIPAFPLDEFLTSVPGLRQYDAGWIVIRGPAMVLTDLAGADNNLIPAGTVLVALTGATSGATTSGRVKPQDLTGATAVLGNEIQGAIGRALSAKTTANTNADLLIDVKHCW